MRGVLPLAVCARREGMRRVLVPADNAPEAAVVGGVEVIGVRTLREVMEHLNGERVLAPAAAPEPREASPAGAMPRISPT